MPLTKFQTAIAKLLAPNRTEDSHLAGGAALHFSPHSIRYSNDLDIFNDSVERVAQAFEKDSATLKKAGYSLDIIINRSGFVRATVSKGGEQTKIEWVHDSSWRFMPPIHSREIGFQLHPIDIAINKTLALAGRDEARDFIDILEIDRSILPLGALCWAAVGKDPGFTPFSLLELLKRRGKYHPEDFQRLMLTGPVDLVAMKTQWLKMLEQAELFIKSQPVTNVGCLYYSESTKSFVAPTSPAMDLSVRPHFGRPGGILPAFA